MTQDLYNKPEKGNRKQQIRSKLMLLNDELCRLHKEKVNILSAINKLEAELESINHV